MDSDADDVFSRCQHLSASPSSAVGRILLKTRETAEAARRASAELGQNVLVKASSLIPGRS
jgi:hypothetical protein